MLLKKINIISAKPSCTSLNKFRLGKKGDLLDAFEPLIMPIAVLIAIIVIIAIVMMILRFLK